MGFFSNFLKRNREEKNSLLKSSLTMDKELSKLAIDLIGVSEDTALVPLKSNDMSGEYARLCRLGLGNSANAKFLKDRISDIDAYNKNIIKARELLDYIKTMNEFLGDSVILVSRDSFYKLCHKYKLSIGFLKQFTGVIPDSNLKELSNIKYKLDHYSGYVKLNTNKHIVRIERIYNFSNKSDFSISKYFDDNFNIISYPAYIYNMDDIEELQTTVARQANAIQQLEKERNNLEVTIPSNSLPDD